MYRLYPLAPIRIYERDQERRRLAGCWVKFDSKPSPQAMNSPKSAVNGIDSSSHARMASMSLLVVVVPVAGLRLKRSWLTFWMCGSRASVAPRGQSRHRDVRSARKDS